MAGALERYEPRVRLSERNSFVAVNEENDGYDITLSMHIAGQESDNAVYRAFTQRLS